MHETDMGFAAEENLKDVEKYTFDLPPIKGYPELRWAGKRPFRSTRYYPAQLKENHGEPVDGWMNELYWGDNLQVMSHLLKKFRGKIKLIYIDPPFDSKADYKMKIKLRGKDVENDRTVFEEKQYTDIWTNDEYLQFMYERLIILRELLAEDGNIYLHCDWRVNSYIRAIMDEVFSRNFFQNEIIWCYKSGGSGSGSFSKKHDTIFRYSKNKTPIFNTMKQKSYMAEGSGKNPAQTYYEDDKGSYTIVNVKDWWDDIGMLATSSHERANYPTQKPEALLERIIIASSNPGDLVADFFMGSGTTQAVAMKLGRRFIGADINLGAIQTTTKRLLNISKDLQEKRELSKQQELYTVADRVPDYGNTPAYYTGFSSFNVNNYDVFKNPVQAKELLIEALEIQKLPGNNLFDGEKDGRMIKIMPVNRIATRVDLNQLISNLDYKSFEKRKAEQPNKPVEHITLVCMGHELDLQASFSEQVPYDVDIDIVDILRDRKDLQFRHEAEAEIMIENGFLVIKSFYPMNLLQKLSMEKENVEDWREMVESIMIDFNYDGSIFEPKEVDIPEKNVLVTGKYSIPDDAGRIRIKITDVLSESFEKDVQ